MSRFPVPIIACGLGLGEFLKTYRRWIVFSRSGLPARSFKWPAAQSHVDFWLGLLGAVGAVVLGQPLAALVPLCASAAAGVCVARLQRDYSGLPVPWRFLWVPFGVLLIGPAVFVSAVLWRGVRWRGRVYELDAHARLA